MLAKDGSNLNILTRPNWHHANQVSNSIDRVGFLIHEGLVPINLLEGYKYVIARSWVVLEPFILANRSARNEPSFQSYFEEMAVPILDKEINRDDIQFMS